MQFVAYDSYSGICDRCSDKSYVDWPLHICIYVNFTEHVFLLYLFNLCWSAAGAVWLWLDLVILKQFEFRAKPDVLLRAILRCNVAILICKLKEFAIIIVNIYTRFPFGLQARWRLELI